MSACRKLAATVALIALYAGVFACGGKERKSVPRPAAAAVPEPEDDAPSDVKLRAACFDGDQSACDKLGH